MTLEAQTRTDAPLRILFVHDDQMVLNGLRRLLHDMRSEWKLAFACGGDEALALLAASPTDVVVSELRMAGMGGIELLETVRERFPDVVRIVLSGSGDTELFLQSTTAAHQFLTMPCDPQHLKDAVSSACFLRENLSSKRLLRVASRLRTLPSRPTLYFDVVEEARSPSGSMERVGEIISKDVGMTAKILQLVNSAYFGLQAQVSSPQDAVSYLGLDTIKALVLSTQIFSQFDTSKLDGIRLVGLWDHSVRAAQLSKAIAIAEDAPADIVAEAFMAGMLHDAGELILAENLPREFVVADDLARKDSISGHEAQIRVLGASHAEVGAHLLAMWGLPLPIVQAVAWHHGPSDASSESFDALTAVHVANCLDRHDGAELERHLDRDYLAGLGLGQRVPDWIAVGEQLSAVEDDG